MKLIKWIIDGWRGHDPVVLELLQRWVGPEKGRAEMLEIVREMEKKLLWKRLSRSLVLLLFLSVVPLVTFFLPRDPSQESRIIVGLGLFLGLAGVTFSALIRGYAVGDESLLDQLEFVRKCQIFSQELPFTSASLELLKTASEIQLKIEAARIKELQKEEEDDNVNNTRRREFAERVKAQANLFGLHPRVSIYFRDVTIELTAQSK